MRILCVDDDEISLAALTRTLRAAGHEAEEARDGLEALEQVREGLHRLVISDWMMPGIDGLELCRRIRAEEWPGYVYIILLTGRQRNNDVVEALTAGADDFLTKPFNADELRVRVRVAERVLSLETRDVAIFALARLAESRDPETGAHLDRVRAYSRLIARLLREKGAYDGEIDAEFVRLIFLTSPLHDIGKVGIPDFVLLKPARLNEREWEIMKTHTTIGAQTLEAAVRQFPGVHFLHMGRDIALTHHERWDGTGYPRGLEGEEIPLCGRIVALADVYDALTSKRVYKQVYSHELARSIILRHSEGQFDPAVVEVFAQNEPEFMAIQERYAEAAMAMA